MDHKIIVVYTSKYGATKQQKNMHIFYLRGGMDYSYLSVPHKIMMSMMKNLTQKKPEIEKTEDDRLMLDTYVDILSTAKAGGFTSD